MHAPAQHEPGADTRAVARCLRHRVGRQRGIGTRCRHRHAVDTPQQGECGTRSGTSEDRDRAGRQHRIRATPLHRHGVDLPAGDAQHLDARLDASCSTGQGQDVANHVARAFGRNRRDTNDLGRLHGEHDRLGRRATRQSDRVARRITGARRTDSGRNHLHDGAGSGAGSAVAPGQAAGGIDGIPDLERGGCALLDIDGQNLAGGVVMGRFTAGGGQRVGQHERHAVKRNAIQRGGEHQPVLVCRGPDHGAALRGGPTPSR